MSYIVKWIKKTKTTIFFKIQYLYIFILLLELIANELKNI